MIKHRGGVRITRPEALNLNLAKYRVLGRQILGDRSVWFYGSHHSAERAIRRLRYLWSLIDEDTGFFRRGVRGADIKVYRIAPPSVEYSRFWIEDDEGVNVTRKLLTQFIHDSNNDKKKKLIEWATEEIIRRGAG